ncbi:MAG: Rpn family recombination-promoting nuclease/putative transposase, partial [Firmicutes bacterium]|nr:Rpn family recombination-promoting nuclease/putative transposase [Bacillota bacterium]
MDLEKLLKLYRDRDFSEVVTNEAIRVLMMFDEYQNQQNSSEISIDLIDDFMRNLVQSKANSVEAIFALARYFYLEGKNDLYIHMTKYLGGIGVIDNIKERIETYASLEQSIAIFDDFNAPQIGTRPQDVVYYTEKLMKRIEKHLSMNEIKKCLAGNNHAVSKEPFLKEKEIYEQSNSLDEYLKEYHQRKISELTTHFEKWLYFLKNLEDFNEIPAILNESIFNKGFEVAR